MFAGLGADWGPCGAHGRQNRARRFEEGTSAKQGERAANWLRSVWKELRIILLETQKQDRPEWMDKAIDDVNSALNLPDEFSQSSAGVLNFKRAPIRGLDIRFITRRRALRSLLLFRVWLVRGIHLK